MIRRVPPNVSCIAPRFLHVAPGQIGVWWSFPPLVVGGELKRRLEAGDLVGKMLSHHVIAVVGVDAGLAAFYRHTPSSIRTLHFGREV